MNTISQFFDPIFHINLSSEFDKWVYDKPIIGSIYSQSHVLGILLLLLLLLLSLLYLIFRNKANLIIGKYLNRFRYLFKKDKDYFILSANPEYIKWQTDIIHKIYNDLSLVEFNSKAYPVVVFPASKGIGYPFNANFGKLNSTEIKEQKLDSMQEKYLKVLGDKLKRPKLEGFAIDKLEFNDNEEIKSFSAHLCNYEQNIVTSHILDFELYKLYKKMKNHTKELSREELLNKLPYRKKLHNGFSNFDVIKNGNGRDSLISVQMFVVYKHWKDKSYKVLTIKRSEDVTSKPKHFQFVPSGGFEVFEKELPHKQVILDNFDVSKAIFRELLEEVFSEGNEYEHNYTGTSVDNILNDSRTIFITNLIEKQEASMNFIGCVIDLITLRPELSFMLMIDNEEFSRKTFSLNHEGDGLYPMTIEALFSDEFMNALIVPSSVGMLKLAINTLEEKNILKDNTALK